MAPRCLALILISSSIAVAAPPPPRGPESAAIEVRKETPEERLARANTAYQHNDWVGIIAAVRGLLYPEITLRSEEDVVAAHRLLALAYLFSDREGDADHEFQALLLLRPDFSLDPVVDPSRAVEHLASLKERERERLYEIEQRNRAEAARQAGEEERRRHELDEKLRKSLEKTIYIERHHYVLNFVPLGVGQFQNGQRKKGFALMATQLAVGAVSLALWGANEIKYANGATPVPPNEVASANAVQISAITFGAAFWATVLYGIIDAMAYYQPQVTVQGPAGTPGPVPRPAPRPPSRSSSLGIAPLVLPGGGGLGLLGVF